MINGTSVLGKGNPRWPISNVAETRKVPAAGAPMLGSWLTDLTRRLGNRLFAMNDAEAGWRDWEVTVTAGGLGRQYRDHRFNALRGQFDAHGGRVEPNATKET